MIAFLLFSKQVIFTNYDSDYSIQLLAGKLLLQRNISDKQQTSNPIYNQLSLHRSVGELCHLLLKQVLSRLSDDGDTQENIYRTVYFGFFVQ